MLIISLIAYSSFLHSLVIGYPSVSTHPNNNPSANTLHSTLRGLLVLYIYQQSLLVTHFPILLYLYTHFVAYILESPYCTCTYCAYITFPFQWNELAEYSIVGAVISVNNSIISPNGMLWIPSIKTMKWDIIVPHVRKLPGHLCKFWDIMTKNGASSTWW